MTLPCFNSKTPCIYSHVNDLLEHEAEYLQQVQHYKSNPMIWSSVSSAMKARIIAALHICDKHAHIVPLLTDIVDIEKALTVLDRPRIIRQLRKKIASIERSTSKQQPQQRTGEPKRKKHKVQRLQNTLKETIKLMEDSSSSTTNPAVQELVSSSSVSGALSRKIRQWAKTIPSDYLEYVLLELPKKSWKTVADLVHFRPSDFQVPYFLYDIYDQEIPNDCFVSQMREFSSYHNIAQQYPQIYKLYSYLRGRVKNENAIMIDLAQNIDLDTFLWHYNDFHRIKECQVIMEERLSDVPMQMIMDGKKSFSYGKLLACILKFRSSPTICKCLEDIAGKRLQYLRGQYDGYDGNENGTIAVFGDASSSMQVAVEAATIFASMVSACLDGELSFFGSDLIPSPHKKPKTVQDTMDVCKKIRANGCTNLAAALWPYYQDKTKIDTIVMVTDEYENGKTDGCNFAQLLKRYKEEVHAAVKFVVVRVGRGSDYFQQTLNANDIKYSVIIIDQDRPDLAKFDALLGQIALLSGRVRRKEEASAKSSTDAAAGTTGKDGDEQPIMGFETVDGAKASVEVADAEEKEDRMDAMSTVKAVAELTETSSTASSGDDGDGTDNANDFVVV